MIRAEEQPPALEIDRLTVGFRRRHGEPTRVVDDVSFSVGRGRTLGVVGESGSGKTMASLAVLQLLPPGAAILEGEVRLNGRAISRLSRSGMRAIRGREIAMVPQDPFASLDPSFTIGDQLAESFHLHRGLRGSKIHEASVQALGRVRISSPAHRLNQYPHQLSGGIQQRITSAIAMAGEPGLLIADEPTTALDVTTQAQYLMLLRELQTRTGYALVLISHDLLVIRTMCADVVVMYAGQVVERGPLRKVFEQPEHPYTRALIGAIPVLHPEGRLQAIEGKPPDLKMRSTGCRFAPRCPFAKPICVAETPELSDRGDGRAARCFGTEPGGWIDG